MKSKLYQPDSPFTLPPSCALGRTEKVNRVIKNGKVYTLTWRTRIAVEDTYLVMVKAAAYAIRTHEQYSAQAPLRAYKDYLIKESVVI